TPRPTDFRSDDRHPVARQRFIRPRSTGERPVRHAICDIHCMAATNRRPSQEIAMTTETLARNDYELFYPSLFDAGYALAFPCDLSGKVDMDGLGRKALANYLYARAFVGREFECPSVRPRFPARHFSGH